MSQKLFLLSLLLPTSAVAEGSYDVIRERNKVIISNLLDCPININRAGKTYTIIAKTSLETTTRQVSDFLKLPKTNLTHGKIGPKQTSYDFNLPFTGTALLTQGFSTGTHVDYLKFSADFDLEVGRDVLAAGGGQVVSIKDGFGDGYFTPLYMQKANEVLICHSDGTLTLYSHLLKNTLKVKVGDKVRVGQVIAKSGNSGYTSAPHLHFDARVPVDYRKYETVKFTFNNNSIIQGYYYGSELHFWQRVSNFFK